MSYCEPLSGPVHGYACEGYEASATPAQWFLEDVYEMTGYALEAGSAAALRGDGRQRQRQQLQTGSASKQSVLKVSLASIEPTASLSTRSLVRWLRRSLCI